jgi:hypothetical protein
MTVAVCVVCGEPVSGEALMPYPPNGDRVHPECAERYWDAPGEAGLTEESW